MKENSKKVPDAPLKLFVKPEHAGFTTEWIDKEGNQHEGYNVWLGVADERTWGYDDCIIDFGDSSYDVGHITEEPDGFYGWRTDWGLYTFEEIVQWAYLKDIVSIKLKKGGK